MAVLALLLLPACGPSVPAGGGEGLVPDCSPQADGRISAEELPTALGLRVRFASNAPGEDWPGLPGGADGLDRDFSDGPAAVGATLEVVDPADAWWSARFPGATHAVATSVSLPDLLGVYRGSPDRLDLLGYVTAAPTAPAQATELHYDQPVTVLQLPLQPGLRWGQQASFRNAVLAGVPEQGVEDWEFEVGDVESARLPDGTELSEVLPVSGRLDQHVAIAVGAPSRTVWSRAWMAPCFGEVASVQADNEGLEPLQTYRRYYP